MFLQALLIEWITTCNQWYVFVFVIILTSNTLSLPDDLWKKYINDSVYMFDFKTIDIKYIPK